MRLAPHAHLLTRLLAVGAIGCAPLVASAHGGAQHDAPTTAAPVERIQQAWGIAGESQEIDRSITIRMSDKMRFSPERIVVRQGETVRFIPANEGGVMHELVIGTPGALKEHAELMKKFPGMEHEEPWMAHVAPGKQGEVVWTFNRPGTFEFACLIPGHFEAGMIGSIEVTPAQLATDGKAASAKDTKLD